MLEQALKYKDIKQRVDRIDDISILGKLIEVIEDELQ